MTAPSTRRLARLLLALAVAATLGGCASTQLTDLWRDTAYQGPPAKKVLVVSMAKDPGRRRIWEDAFVTQLQKKGVDATPSWRPFPEAVPDTQTVKEKVRTEGYQAVLVTHFIGSENVERFVPPAVTSVPVGNASPWGYYHTYYDQVYQPGYVENDRVMHFQTDMWVADGKGGRLVWIGRSESVNPSSPSDVSKELSGSVIPELRKVGLL